jgi:hypothetical protein
MIPLSTIISSTITADMDITDLNDEQLQAFKEVSGTSI